MEELTKFSVYEKLGIDEIDEQHKAINDCIEALYKTTPPDLIQEQIDAARIATALHFEYEEELMRKHQYPWLESHLEIHKEAIKQFSDVYNKPTHTNLVILHNFFLDHIDRPDRLFAQWLKSHLHRRKTDNASLVIL